MERRLTELGWTLDELSFRTRIGVRLLGSYKRNEHNPGVDKVHTIMRAFGDSLPWDADSGESSTARKISLTDWPIPTEPEVLVPAAVG